MQKSKIKNQNERLKIKNFLVLVLILLSTFYFLLYGLALADEIEGDSFVYLFHLYYDNDQLFADRDLEFKYDVIPEEFSPEVLTTQFPYKGEIVSVKGQIVSIFLFDPRRGNPDFRAGKISVKAPYAPNGQKAVFYDSQNRPLVTIFVSESSFCNEDGMCNFDRGEDKQTCPNDCTGVTPTPSAEPEERLFSNTSLNILIALAIAALAAGGWYIWRRRKKVKHVEESKPADKLS